MINEKESIEVMNGAIKKYGVEKQLLVCMEESAELIQAISKMERYPDDEKCKEHLTEEMADVLVCLEYLKLIYEIDQKQIEKWINRKIERVSKKLKVDETRFKHARV